jgi:hypothetical protein
MKYPFVFAHCPECHGFWEGLSGEFLVHRCGKRNLEEVHLPTRLALKPEAEPTDPDAPKLYRLPA